MNSIALSVIIPVFNEAHCLSDALSRIKKCLEAAKVSFEIMTVDDASSDESLTILRREAAADPRIKVLRHLTNKGYGASLLKGINACAGSLVAIIDADGTYPYEELPRLLQEMGTEYDMVVGSRTGKAARGSLARQAAKGFLTNLAQYLTGRDIPDINSGMRIMKKEIVLRYAHIIPKNFSFTTTITLAMLTNDYEVKYVPISYHKRAGGRSKIRPLKETLNFTQLIIRTVLYFNPLKFFIPLGFFLFACFLILFIRDAMLVRLSIKTLLLFVAFLITFTTGCLADLIDKRLMR